MKKIEKEYTRVEKEIYFEAWDGERFKNEDDCLAYESNALGVIGKKVQLFRVTKTNEYYLFEPLGLGGEDYDVEVYRPASAKDIESLNMYLNMYNKNIGLLSEDCIGKEIIIFFSYDRDWCRATTFDELVDELRNHFETKIIKKDEEKKEGSN